MNFLSINIEYGNEFDQLCRICAEKSSNMTSLFHIERETSTLTEMLAICTHNKINQMENNRPSNICFQCRKNLNIAFDFYNLVNKSEKKFQQIISMHVEPSEAKYSNAIDLIKQENELIVEDIYSEELPKQQITLKSIDKILFDGSCSEFNSFLEENTHSTEKNMITKTEAEKHHTESKDTKRSFECFLCREKFDGFRITQYHIKRVHDDATPHICSICTMRFSEQMFELHLCGGKNVKCEYCSIVFQSTIKLLRHLNENHKQNQALHKCTRCNKRFPMAFLLQQHSVIHKFQKLLFPCDKCDKKFTQRGRLRVHLNQTHSTMEKRRKLNLLHFIL